jgi:drug/metabolite transporter (DMT)-like permease
MPTTFALITALAYGCGDFLGGLASRKVSPALVTAVGQVMGLGCSCVAVLLFPGAGPDLGAVLWGAASGIGSLIGLYFLYKGLSGGRMSIAGPMSGLIGAMVPVLVSLALGDELSAPAVAGIALALPAIILISWTSQADGRRAISSAVYGAIGGIGFALVYIALDRAGTDSGAWPLVVGQATSLLLIAPVGLAVLRRVEIGPSVTAQMIGGGFFTGLANLTFLAATNGGALAIIAILTALYPGVSVSLARLVLNERLSPMQGVGLAAALSAAVLISVGSI